MSWPVSVTRFHLIQKPGIIKAFATVQIGPLVISGCRLLETREGGLWVAMPQEQSKKDNKWYDVVQVQDRELKAEIGRVVRERYEQGTVPAADGPREDVQDTPWG